MPKKPFSFMCSACGKEHTEPPHIAHHAPDPYVQASPEIRARDFTLTSDTCVMKEGTDTYFFIRCALLVPIVGIDEPFGWGIWVSLSETNYSRYISLPDEDLQHEVPYFGWLMNSLPRYPETYGVKTEVYPQSGNKRPLIELEPGDHPLAIEQRDGISLKRAIELVTPYLHGPDAADAKNN